MVNENPVEIIHSHKERSFSDVLKSDWDKKAQTNDYGEAKEALEKVSSLRRFREVEKQSSFGEFYSLIENVNTLKNFKLSADEMENKKQELIENTLLLAQGQSPRINDFYKALISEFEGREGDFQFETTKNIMQILKDDGDLNVLLDSSFSLDSKIDRMEKRVESYLKGAKALDRREGKIKNEEEKKEREEKLKNDSSTPPPAQEESKPSMDEMERLTEGEKALAIWTINPAHGGYFKEQSFDVWDNEQNKWKQSSYEYADVDFREAKAGEKIISSHAQIQAGQWTRIPVPYTHELINVNSGKFNCIVRKDQNGDCVILANEKAGGLLEVEIILTELENLRSANNAPTKMQNMPCVLSQETENKIKEIEKRKTGNLAQARALASYAMQRIKYSNDSSYNEIYDTHEKGYVGAIDELKQADCDVSNTYFAGLCARLNIPVRHCVGHMVKGKNEDGNSCITSGTGHAWSEVWDEENGKWERVDATSPGDPQLSDDEEKNNEAVPGDYGAQEAIRPSDEYLKELEEKLSQSVEKLSYTAEERELSEIAGIEMREAREIVKEIEKAENTLLPNGDRVVDVLSSLFNLIIESRKTSTPDYTGPLRKREGGEEIDDIVAHYIGTKAGEADPMSRQKEFERKKEEKMFGGFDFFMIGDKSGSMSETVDGQAKWKTQRLAEYLIFSALHRFDANLKRASIVQKNSLSVRTRGISFRDSRTIDEDKSLSGKFQSMDKVNLWRSLGNQGSGNGDVVALIEIRDQIKREIEEMEKNGKKDDRLRFVVPCSDGYPDDVEKVHQLVEELGKMNAVVVGIGLTESARAVKTIFTTQWSRGDVATSIDDLPMIVAKHLVFEAVKLFPEKSQKNAKIFIDSILNRFKNVGE